jgi:hypothetical protein
MGAARRVQMVGPIGLCFLSLLFLRLAWLPPADRSTMAASHPFGLRPLRGPCDAALREARFWHLRAMQEVSAQFDALEAWDPDALAVRDVATWRRLMAGDRRGDLRRAREAARRAVRLARTPEDAFQTRLMLSRLDCEAGDHEAELQQARQVIALRPRSFLSLVTLKRAAECNGLARLARQTGAKLAASLDAPARLSLRTVCGDECGKYQDAPLLWDEGAVSESSPGGRAPVLHLPVQP